MLNTETNTRTMERRIMRAARARFGRRRLQADYEHGQWWITDLRSGAQWSVCDSSGPEPTTVNGFSFEQVTRGDE